MYRQMLLKLCHPHSLSQGIRPAVATLTRQSLLSSAAEFPSSSESTEDGTRREKCINQVTLLGRVGIGPQLRGSEEHPVTIFSMATHSTYKYQNGEIQQKTEWHRVSIFKPHLRTTVLKFLRKGQRVLIQGKLMYGQITDTKGSVHTTSTIVADEVVFFNDGQAEQDDQEAEVQ